jgi:pyruvate dehydrogenase E2 component (dihydrolipoamide acetyltransferase)
MTPTAEIVMPKLGLTMTEGRIARWVVAPGAHFAAGDVIVEIETDKIVNEVEAPAAGTLLELLEPEGATTPVGTPIARWRSPSGSLSITPRNVACSPGARSPPTRACSSRWRSTGPRSSAPAS